MLKELSKLPNIYDRLARLLIKNMWELDGVKRGLPCQVFSSNIFIFPLTGSSHKLID
jgi:DNA replicative helicase MCM subunit Mcm2 (Cdc46/Mcm family)